MLILYDIALRTYVVVFHVPPQLSFYLRALSTLQASSATILIFLSNAPHFIMCPDLGSGGLVMTVGHAGEEIQEMLHLCRGSSGRESTHTFPGTVISMTSHARSSKCNSAGYSTPMVRHLKLNGNVTLQCCVTVSVHVGIHVMTLYDVTGFNNTVSIMCMQREVRCMMVVVAYRVAALWIDGIP